MVDDPAESERQRQQGNHDSGSDNKGVMTPAWAWDPAGVDTARKV